MGATEASMLLETLLANTAIALVLVFLTGCLNAFWRRPGVLHALWLLVIVKLITPPLFTLKRDRSEWAGPVSGAATISAPAPEASTLSEATDDQALAFSSAYSPEVFVDESTSQQRAIVAKPIPWLRVLAGIWLGGSVLVFLVWLFVFCRLRSMVRSGVLSDELLSRRVSLLAQHVGCRRVPDLRVLSTGTGPFVASWGSRPMLLVSQWMLEALTAEQLDTALVHELVHLRRGDHWVRWAEAFVTFLLWWHPLAGGQATLCFRPNDRRRLGFAK